MTTKAKAAGLSGARLETLDRFIQANYIDSGKIPGALTVIARRGEVAHMSALGLADVERKTPMREDTIFRAYSMSKPITSVAFMTLVERGLVALDTPVHQVIPEWENLGVYRAGFMETFQVKRPERPMLMIDLLRHTSGLTYGFQQTTNVDAAYRKLKIGEREGGATLDDMIRDLGKVPLEFSPGTAWNYSVSTDVLGYLIEKLSGMRFGEFLRTRLFEPLGMSDTEFWVPSDKTERFASCYVPQTGGSGLTLQDDALESIYYASPPRLESGGNGLVSTAHDYLRFCCMMLNGGTLDGVQILSPKTVAQFSVNYLPDGREMADMAPPGMFGGTNYAGVGFSLGGGVTVDVAKTRLPGSLGQYFWGAATGSAFWIDPKEEMAVVFMTQVIFSQVRETLRRDLRTLVYSAMTESLA